RLLSDSELVFVDGNGTVLVALTGPGWSTPVGASIAGSELYRFTMARDREAFREVTDHDRRAQVWTVARAPSTRVAPLTILVGRPKDGLVGAAHRRLHEDIAMLAVSLMVLT
ncbi:hypothetical protein, partial [Salmonella enterica]|uniref:hypothetical protein n=1 Tax=Salmonella enterica TaxID=28901 RepID=UPI0018E0AAAD